MNSGDQANLVVHRDGDLWVPLAEVLQCCQFLPIAGWQVSYQPDGEGDTSEMDALAESDAVHNWNSILSAAAKLEIVWELRLYALSRDNAPVLSLDALGTHGTAIDIVDLSHEHVLQLVGNLTSKGVRVEIL